MQEPVSLDIFGDTGLVLKGALSRYLTNSGKLSIPVRWQRTPGIQMSLKKVFSWW